MEDRPEFREKVVCPHCCEGELEPCPDEAFWLCAHCRRPFAESYVETLVHRREQKALGVSEGAIEKMLREDAKKKRGKGGRSSKSYGKDDKLGGRVTLGPVWDDSIVAAKVSAMDPKTVMLQFRGLPEDVTSEQIRQAVFAYCRWIRMVADDGS